MGDKPAYLTVRTAWICDEADDEYAAPVCVAAVIEEYIDAVEWEAERRRAAAAWSMLVDPDPRDVLIRVPREEVLRAFRAPVFLAYVPDGDT